MQRVEAYRVEVAVVTKDEYSKELEKAEKAIDDLEKKTKKGAKAHDDLAKSSKDVAKAQDGVTKSTKSAAKGVEDVGKSAEQAEKKVSRITKTYHSFGSKIKSLQRAKANIEVTVKDNATRTFGRIKSMYDGFRRDPAVRLSIFAVDRATRVLNGIRKSIFSIPTMISIGVGVIAGSKLFGMGKDAVGSSISKGMHEQLSNVTIGSMLRDDKATKSYMSFMKKLAQDSPVLDYGQMMDNSKYIIAQTKNAKELRKSWRVIEKLQTLDPAQGTDGAAFALKEMFSGDAISLVERFGFEKAWANQVKKLSIDKQLTAFEKQLAKMGIDDTTITDVAATMRSQINQMTETLEDGSRSFGAGIIKSVSPIMTKFNSWFDKNEDKWSRMKDTANQIGEGLSKWSIDKIVKQAEKFSKKMQIDDILGVFTDHYSTNLASGMSVAEKGNGWSRLQSQFNESENKENEFLVSIKGREGWAYDLRKTAEQNFKDGPIPVSFEAKMGTAWGMISDNVSNYMNETVKPALSSWWGETGSGVALEIGKGIGSGIVEGIKLGIQAGGELLTSSYSDLFENLKKDPFSKDTGKSALGAMATTAGAAYLGKKLIYNPGRSVYRGGKKAKGWIDKGPDRKQTRQQKWNESNNSRTERRLARGDRAAEKKATREAARSTRIPKGSGKLLRRVPVLGAAITGMSMFGATDEEIPGMVGGLAGGLGGAKLGAMGGAALGSIVPGVGTAIGAGVGGLAGGIGGAIGGDKLLSWLFGPKKASASALDGDSSAPSSVLGGNETSFGQFNLNTETLQRNIDTLTTYVGEASGHVVGAFQPLVASTSTMQHNVQVLTGYLGEASSWVVGAFHPLSEGTSVLQHNIQALTMHLGDASGHVAGAFYPMSEQGPVLQQNTSALSTNLAEASVSVVESFYPLSENGPVMNQNVSALTTNLAESSSWVVGAFYPLSESGPTLTNNVSVLSSWVAQASGWVNSLYGIQDGAAAVKGALSNLASRISRVPTPSVSVGGGGPASGPRVTAYARGGVATSPHIGLVGEAGVNESMIPWDGSNRSKALWQQTGEALGMFGGDSSSSGGGNAAVATSGMTGGSSGGMALSIGDINVNGGNNMSAEEILNMITPALYERIKATLAKR